MHSLQLSVIVPTRNRAAELRQCLEALALAQVAHMECIVIDDASTVPVTGILKAASLPTTLIRLDKQSGSANARSVASATARGEILLFVDDDVCVQPGSLRAVLSAFRNDPTLGAVMGRYDDAPSSPHFLSQFRNLLHAYTHRISAGPASTFWTGFGAIRSTVYHQHGGFAQPARVIEDIEFGTRLSAAGVRIELRPDLQVKHLKRWTLKSMLYTDLLLRGVPWTMLLWRRRTMPNTLNLRHSNRLSVILAFLSLLLTAATAFEHLHWAFAAAAIAAVLLLNLNFYRFLRTRHGNRFAFGGVAAHWLYLFTAGLSFGIGTALFFVQSLRTQPAVGVIESPDESFSEAA